MQIREKVASGLGPLLLKAICVYVLQELVILMGKLILSYEVKS